MRKRFSILAIGMMCCAAAVVMTSCSDDNSSPKQVTDNGEWLVPNLSLANPHAVSTQSNGPCLKLFSKIWEYLLKMPTSSLQSLINQTSLLSRARNT